jgi:hypothetical protein
MSAKLPTLERSSRGRFDARVFPPLSQEELQAKIADLKDKVRTTEQPSVRHDLKVDLVDYQNAILKIAYEFAWLWLGDTYLDDPIAVKLRRKILGNADEQLRGVIQIGTTAPFDKLWTDEPNALLALGQVCGAGVAISVRIFDVLCGLVVVSDECVRYPEFRQ